jgi:hypothetical protein
MGLILSQFSRFYSKTKISCTCCNTQKSLSNHEISFSMNTLKKNRSVNVEKNKLEIPFSVLHI